MTEDKGHRYAFRSTSNTLIEGRAAAILMAQQPFKRYAIAGPDYEYGHRMGEDFVTQLKKLRPDVQIVTEVWPKLGERDFTPHINALLQAKPDMVFSAIWGGDHIAFVKQAKPYGFFSKTQYLAIGQGDLDVVVPLGAEAPEGLEGQRLEPPGPEGFMIVGPPLRMDEDPVAELADMLVEGRLEPDVPQGAAGEPLRGQRVHLSDQGARIEIGRAEQL